MWITSNGTTNTQLGLGCTTLTTLIFQDTQSIPLVGTPISATRLTTISNKAVPETCIQLLLENERMRMRENCIESIGIVNGNKPPILTLYNLVGRGTIIIKDN
ncbi:hypothetical protein LINPERHAP1_LOCUS11367 [Linum perenne]